MTNTSQIENLWQRGPDEIMPAESFYSTTLSEPVNLRLNDNEIQEYPPMSIYTMFKKTVDQNPNQDALAFKPNDKGDWAKFTYLEYWKMCNKAAKSFIKLGLQPNEPVGIIGFNSPQWFVSILGAIFAGGVGCGMYTTNSTEACDYILEDSNTRIVVVENKMQLSKILNCKSPVKRIIQYSGNVENNHDGLVMSWKEFIEYGNDIPESHLQARVKSIAPNKCASLIYTSGTTGQPKAAMISHDAITYLVRYIGLTIVRFRKYQERFVSYLPLSHIAAQAIDIYCAILVGGTVYFASPDALKGALTQTLKDVRPTFFFGVPRVWEKVQEGITKIMKNLTGVKLSLFEWARKTASEQVHAQFRGSNRFSPSFDLAKLLVLNKIHRELGLDKCRNFVSGAAPITKDTLDFFISLGMPICEVYGMSESTGPHSIGTSDLNRVCSVGPARKFNRSKLIGQDNDGSGELCVYGRHVFMGYLNERKKTEEAFDEEGYLRTGDIAKIEEGFIYITGRLKEIIITAGGENIAPVPIEDNVKSELSNLVSNCMLIGDKRKYLAMLITLKCKIDPDTTEPKNELTPECISYLQSIGSTSTLVTDIINNKDHKVYKAIENGIKKANEKSPSRAAKVQKFTILEKDFSLFNGELGPTLKLRRPIVVKKYSNAIEELYKDTGNSNE